MRGLVPVIVGAILLLIGIAWASQGSGMMGGSSLMDHNSTFIYLGGAVAVVAIVLIALGAVWETKSRTPVVAPAS